MLTPQRLVIGLVILLAAAGIAVVALTGGPSGVATATPTPTAQPTADATEDPTVSPSPSEEEVLAVLLEIEAQVIAIRGLESAGIGPPELLTREELRVELQQLFDEEYSMEERARDNVALRALGLLEPGEDVAELQLAFLGDQVLGFYDDVDKRMVVVTEAGLDAEAKLTYAHEYTHALQDAAFGIDSLETDAEGEDDRGLARTALIEGDATVTMLAWAFRHLTPQELMELSQAPVPDTGDAPYWMVAALLFPYEAGLTWAGTLVQDPTDPDFSAIDAAWLDPPSSTKQILDIAAWREREEPVGVDLPDLAAAMGPDWEEVETNSMGQAFSGMMLEHFGLGRGEARVATDGWTGDRMVIASGPNDAFAVVWISEWETDADADEFLAAYDSIIPSIGFPAVVQELDGRILVAHGSDDVVHRRSLAAAGG